MKVYFYILFCVIASLATPSVGLSSNWVFYAQASDQSMYYYDKESLTYSPTGIIKVWDKQVYSETSRDYMISKRRQFNEPIEGYGNLQYTLMQLEFDSRKRRSRIIKMIDYDHNGEMLASYNGNEKVWHYTEIAPDTLSEALFTETCSRKKKRR